MKQSKNDIRQLTKVKVESERHADRVDEDHDRGVDEERPLRVAAEAGVLVTLGSVVLRKVP